jgi:hypothetical protein
MNWTELGIVIDDNEEHARKQEFWMDWTDFGISIDDNEEHPKKQEHSIVWTEFGIVIDDNEEHPRKQFFPMNVTELGITKLLKLLYPRKHRAGKHLAFSGISNVSINRFKMRNLPLTIRKFSDNIFTINDSKFVY